VVGYAAATQDLPEGATVEVDGETGQVTIQDQERTS
jgi:phosphohistidine swiveling domain-containing protein